MKYLRQIQHEIKTGPAILFLYLPFYSWNPLQDKTTSDRYNHQNKQAIMKFCRLTNDVFSSIHFSTILSQNTTFMIKWYYGNYVNKAVSKLV